MPARRRRHPNAKDHLWERARELRRQGRRYDEIAAELGVSKSSVSLWVRDLPKPPRVPDPDRMTRMSRAYWGPVLRRREAERREVRSQAASEVGALSERELLIAGVALYWAEGAKSKPHRRSERVVFVNSDPDVISVYLRWLDLLAVDRSRLRFAVNIHESADVAAAERFWAQHIGIPASCLQKASLKRHNPKTTRLSAGPRHRGCLRVVVLGGADLYRRIEGWWYGIVEGVSSAAGDGCPN
ncbi:helix-turn-helix transcriptional regulator [Streptomyces sp. JJ38]|nr:helix-turn-helix transcriptional regulator [Streptomyces sp. JJ38]